MKKALTTDFFKAGGAGRKIFFGMRCGPLKFPKIFLVRGVQYPEIPQNFFGYDPFEFQKIFLVRGFAPHLPPFWSEFVAL